MAPRATTVTETGTEEQVVSVEPIIQKTAWRNVIFLSAIHVLALYGLLLLPTCKSPWKMLLFTYFLANVSELGVTAGVHRLWCHRSYKARTPLRIILMLLNSMAFQGDIYKWSRDHRVHHKFTDTNADPYNSKRGFFFSHMGWLLVNKHPEVTEKGQVIDFWDILSDPVVRFQMKYYFPLAVVMSFIMPTYLTMWLLGEPFWKGFFIAGVFRYCLTLHLTWLVNSAAHMYGYRPYDKNISPCESPVVIMLGMGEGFHNYHHTFPWDYSTGEWGMKMNMSTAFINLMAKIGQAYELKSVTPEMVKKSKLTAEKNDHEY